jgi:hypothetical protein
MELWALIIAGASLIASILTFYKSHLERARIKLFSSDGVFLVREPGDESDRLHFAGVFRNDGAHTAVIQHLEGHLWEPDGTKRRLIWDLFVDYKDGGRIAVPKSSAHATAVPPRDAVLLEIQFGVDVGEAFRWIQGDYRLSVHGWMNRRDMSGPPDFGMRPIHFRLGGLDPLRITVLGKQAQMYPVSVLEWSWPEARRFRGRCRRRWSAARVRFKREWRRATREGGV